MQLGRESEIEEWFQKENRWAGILSAVEPLIAAAHGHSVKQTENTVSFMISQLLFQGYGLQFQVGFLYPADNRLKIVAEFKSETKNTFTEMEKIIKGGFFSLLRRENIEKYLEKYLGGQRMIVGLIIYLKTLNMTMFLDLDFFCEDSPHERTDEIAEKLWRNYSMIYTLRKKSGEIMPILPMSYFLPS